MAGSYVSYPYEVQDALPMVMLRDTGIADIANYPSGNTYAKLLNFNGYRTQDKLIQRMNVYSDSIYNLNAVSLHTFGRGVTFGFGSTANLLPLRFTVLPFTALSPNGAAGSLPIGYVAEFIPPWPIIIRQMEELTVIAYFVTDGAAGLLSTPIRFTTTFTYVNRDGVPPNELYQG